MQGDQASTDFVQSIENTINDDLPEEFLGWGFDDLPLSQQDAVFTALGKEYNITEKEVLELIEVYDKPSKLEDLVTGAGDVTSAVIKFPKDELGKNIKPNFTLYAAAPATVMGVLSARQHGYSDDEITAQLEAKGEDAEEVFETAGKVQAARDAGYTDEQIESFLGGAPTQVDEVDTEFLDPAVDTGEAPTTVKSEDFAKIVDTEREMDLPELVAAMQVVHPNMMSVTMRTAGFFGNEAAARQAEQASAAQAQRIVNLAKDKFNIQLEWDSRGGTFIAELPHGKVEVTPGLLDTLFAEGGELTGALLGGAGGGYLGSRGGAWGALAGSLLGAVGGSIVGTEVDYLRKAIDLQVDFQANVMAHKAMTAAEASVIGDVVGFGVLKGLGKGWSFLDNTYQAIKDGNSKGAAEAIKKFYLCRIQRPKRL